MRMMRDVLIEHFVSGLCSIPEKDFKVGIVYDFLKRNPVDEDSLSPYIFFSKNHYTRNLIFKNELFELVAVCWDVGQVSQIHDHFEQNCWMTMPVGRLRIDNYRVVEQDPETRFCRVEPADSFDIHRGAPAAEVNPEEPVHKVSNLPEFNGRSVSLHIYSRPFNRCVVYSLDKNEYREIELTYASVDGKLCDGVRL